MFKVVTELLLHRQLRFDEGRIFIFGRPSSLLPSDSFVNILKELEKRGLENIIYFAGKESGKLWFKEMYKVYRLTEKDVIKWGSNIVTLAGWGEAVIKKRDDQNRLIVFALNNSVTSELYGKSDHAVDHLFRGLLCGAMSFIYNTNLDAVEIKCKAMGDLTCEFIVKPKENFDYTNRIVQRQLAPLTN
jgi:predicted hydrocarbon binding protein